MIVITTLCSCVEPSLIGQRVPGRNMGTKSPPTASHGSHKPRRHEKPLSERNSHLVLQYRVVPRSNIRNAMGDIVTSGSFTVDPFHPSYGGYWLGARRSGVVNTHIAGCATYGVDHASQEGALYRYGVDMIRQCYDTLAVFPAPRYGPIATSLGGQSHVVC